MSHKSNVRYTGTVIFYSGIYGFIQCETYPNNLYFNTFKERLKKDSISLLDIVEFDVIINTNLSSTYHNSPYAINLKLVEQGVPSTYRRYIGKTIKKNGKTFISHASFDEDIFVNFNRFIYNKKVKTNTLVVFHPIRAINDSNNLHALFAYSIYYENDKEFIQREYNRTQNELLLPYISLSTTETGTLIETPNLLTLVDEKHVTESNAKEVLPCPNILTLVDSYLLDNWNSENYDCYTRLKAYLIEIDFIEKTKYESNKSCFNIFAEYLDPEVLLIMFLDGFLKYFKDLNYLYLYYFKSTVTNKKNILKTLGNKEDLRYMIYIWKKLLSPLQVENKIDVPLQVIKNLLFFYNIYMDINFDKSQIDIEKDMVPIIEYIYNYQTPEAVSQLIKKYNIPKYKSFNSGSINLEDKNSIRIFLHNHDKESGNKQLVNILIQCVNRKEPKLLEFIWNSIQLLEKKSLKTLLGEISLNLSLDTKIALQLLAKLNGIKQDLFIISESDVIDSDISVFYKVCFSHTLNEKENYFNKYFKKLSPKETTDDILKFCSNYQWNEETIYPVTVQNNIGVLDILKKIPEINLPEIIRVIDNSSRLISVRLWINDYINDTPDYFESREIFSLLTYQEKKLFRIKQQSILNSETPEIYESLIKPSVLPCVKFEIRNTGIITYQAYIENIYFSLNKLALKTGYDQFTDYVQYNGTSVGFNYIPRSSQLNQIVIEITVKENKITSINGLNNVIDTIKFNEIIKLTPNNDNQSNFYSENVTYNENLLLKSNVISYLKAENDNSLNLQCTFIESTSKLKNDNKETEALENLYILDNNETYLIVWENISLSQNKATYVFICYKEDILSKTEDLKETISTYYGIRSALTSRTESPLNNLLRRKLGFLGSIRKKRGSKSAFNFWLTNLNEFRRMSVPLDLNFEEQNKLGLEIRSIIYNPSHNYNLHNKKAKLIVNSDSFDKLDISSGQDRTTNDKVYAAKENLLKHLNQLELTLNQFLK